MHERETYRKKSAWHSGWANMNRRDERWKDWKWGDGGGKDEGMHE